MLGLAVLAAAMGWAGAARADDVSPVYASFTATCVGYYGGPYVTVYDPASNSMAGTYATPIYWTYSDFSGPKAYKPLAVGSGPYAPDFATFCVDASKNIGGGWSSAYQVTDLAKAPQIAGIDGLSTKVSSATAVAHEIEWLFYQPAYTPDFTSNSTSAAKFQLAVWDLIYENYKSGAVVTADASYMDDTVVGGVVIAKGVTTMVAEAKLHANFTEPNGGSLYAMVSQSTQDQGLFLSVTSGGDLPKAVPAPAAVWGGGALLLLTGLVALRRRVRSVG